MSRCHEVIWSVSCDHTGRCQGWGETWIYHFYLSICWVSSDFIHLFDVNWTVEFSNERREENFKVISLVLCRQSISAKSKCRRGNQIYLETVVAFCLDINICGEARRRGRDSNKSSVELISLSWLHQPPPPQSNTPVSHKSVCHRTVAFELAQIYHYSSEIIGFVYLFTLGR